ncbi:MAG: CHRD domain-containing protein [Maribacter sp.]
MKFKKTMRLMLPMIMGALVITSCSNDDDGGIILPIGQGDSKTYQLESVANPDISGTAKVIDNDDNSITVELDLQNTPAGGMHPAHIHFNTAAEGGDIAITLGTVDGSTGTSSITFTTLNDGTPITYEEVLAFDGYINVHASADDLGTLVAQGDIGQNELTGTTKVYALGSVAFDDIEGTATFSERVNGEALATVVLSNTPADGMHPGHIHANTAVEGGDIIFSFTTLNGATGISKTNVAALEDGTDFGYAEVLEVDGYINFHLSSDELGTLVAQGDIGQNELTGTAKTYTLDAVANPSIFGTATFEQRVNGEALATIMLEGTPEDGMHPGHIHANSAAEGGAILFTFSPVNGTTGMSKTNVAALNDETAFGYDDVLAIDGYINVHLSADDLGTLVAQGDIGQNELTGTSKSYTLNTVDVPGIDGTATFFERVNGNALAIVELAGTTMGNSHPGHIHANSASETGPIIFDLTNVNGATGISKTHVEALNDGTAFGFQDVLTVDGYINIHLSAADLATLVAQGNIGANEDAMNTDAINYDVTNTGTSAYVLNGGDLDNASNPDLTLTRGMTYTFTVNASGHPFFIKTVQGNTNANAYNSGVTNNGAQTGTISFTVPMDAPDTLFYNCQFHSAMTGTFTIVN